MMAFLFSSSISFLLSVEVAVARLSVGCQLKRRAARELIGGATEPGPWPSRSRDRSDVDAEEDDGDVVGPAGGVGGVDQGLAGGLAVQALADDRLVVGDLAQPLPLPHEVGAAVADLGELGPAVADQRDGGHGGAHAP